MQNEAECHLANTMEMCKIERYLVKQYKEIYNWVQLVAEKIGSPLPKEFALAAVFDKLIKDDNENEGVDFDVVHQRFYKDERSGNHTSLGSAHVSANPTSEHSNPMTSPWSGTTCNTVSSPMNRMASLVTSASDTATACNRKIVTLHYADKSVANKDTEYFNTTGWRAHPMYVSEDINDNLDGLGIELNSSRDDSIQSSYPSHPSNYIPSLSNNEPTSEGDIYSSSDKDMNENNENVVSFAENADDTGNFSYRNDFLSDTWIVKDAELLNPVYPNLQY